MSTSLLVSTGAVICYAALIVNLIWFADEIIHRVSTKQHGDIKSGVTWSKNSTFSQARCASALSCSSMWKTNCPHRHVNAITSHVFCGCNCNCKTKNLSSMNHVSHHRSRVATDSTSWD